jgi:hypothetical protein
MAAGDYLAEGREGDCGARAISRTAGMEPERASVRSRCLVDP